MCKRLIAHIIALTRHLQVSLSWTSSGASVHCRRVLAQLLELLCQYFNF